MHMFSKREARPSEPQRRLAFHPLEVLVCEFPDGLLVRLVCTAEYAQGHDVFLASPWLESRNVP